MGDPAPNAGEIPPVQAPQLPGADEENHAPAIVAQPAMAVQAVSVANYQVPLPQKFSFKPEDFQDTLDSALRKISKSDWSRSKKWREPSEHFGLLHGQRSR